MPLNAMMSHTTTWLTITTPGAYRKTRIRPGECVRTGASRGDAVAKLTTGAQELLSGPTALKTSLRPEWAGSTVSRLALVLRKVMLEACSSRSGPLSVCGQRKQGLLA